MQIVVHVELITDRGEARRVEVARIERPSQTLDAYSVGLSLGDGKQLLHSLQQAVVCAQTEEIHQLSRICRGCNRRTPIKDYRQRKIDTVFGSVSFRSPRIITCECDPPYFMSAPLRPLRSIVPERATPELQALQARMADRMSYRQAAAILGEFLPLGDRVNHGTVRNRTWRVGARIDKIALKQTVVSPKGTNLTLAIDGGFVRGRERGGSGNFEMLVGRLKALGCKPYVFAFTRGEVESTVDRLSELATVHSGQSRPALTVVTDGANSLQHIHRQLPFPARPILDWFHVSMRVRYLEQIAGGLLARTDTDQVTKRLLIELLGKLRWCFWHANVEKAEDRMRQVLLMCRIVVAETPKFGERLAQLDYRLREFFDYLQNNRGTTINYGKLHRAGQPISTAMAESAVNQVLNHRMCKRQQMRWTPRGAHLLAQVRCAVINGDLNAKLEESRAQCEEPIGEDVLQFLAELQRAATATTPSF